MGWRLLLRLHDFFFVEIYKRYKLEGLLFCMF